MSDYPTLGARLSLIGRQSGLDSRAALSVWSPVSAAGLSEFIERYPKHHFHESKVSLNAVYSKPCMIQSWSIISPTRSVSAANATATPIQVAIVHLCRPSRPLMRIHCALDCEVRVQWRVSPSFAGKTRARSSKGFVSDSRGSVLMCGIAGSTIKTRTLY